VCSIDSESREHRASSQRFQGIAHEIKTEKDEAKIEAALPSTLKRIGSAFSTLPKTIKGIQFQLT